MRGLLLSAALLLGACDVAQEVADTVARDEAKRVVNGIVAQELPGVNAAPVTDCVIDNASAQDLLTVATAAATGVTPRTTNLVLDIAKRPATLRCIINNGGGLLVL